MQDEFVWPNVGSCETKTSFGSSDARHLGAVKSLKRHNGQNAARMGGKWGGGGEGGREGGGGVLTISASLTDVYCTSFKETKPDFLSASYAALALTACASSRNTSIDRPKVKSQSICSFSTRSLRACTWDISKLEMAAAISRPYLLIYSCM